MKFLMFVFLMFVGIWLLRLFTNSFEGFEANDIKKLNDSLKSVIDCGKTTCDDTKIRNIVEFKKQTGWSKFNVFLFLKLLKLRESGEITVDQVTKLIKEGSYNDSFSK
jgi:hypothetical protein